MERGGDGERGRWRDGEMERGGDGERGRWREGEMERGREGKSVVLLILVVRRFALSVDGVMVMLQE
jgi:hypothetical protein